MRDYPTLAINLLNHQTCDICIHRCNQQPDEDTCERWEFDTGMIPVSSRTYSITLPHGVEDLTEEDVDLIIREFVEHNL